MSMYVLMYYIIMYEIIVSAYILDDEDLLVGLGIDHIWTDTGISIQYQYQYPTVPFFRTKLSP